MLITDYLVGRDKQQKPLCLVVKGVLMTECQVGTATIISKATRTDLVQSFIQDDGSTEFIAFPDLPQDVVELLEGGRALTILDAEDHMQIDCVLEDTTSKVKYK